MNEDELLYLLKHGRADDIRFIFKDIQARTYPEDFPTFIDAMIREHKIKRKDIAIRSGLSQDYTYKLLRERRSHYLLRAGYRSDRGIPSYRHAGSGAHEGVSGESGA